MNSSLRLLPLCLGIGLYLFSPAAEAKSKSPAPAPAPLAAPAAEPPPLPPEQGPKIDPAAPPSASLQPFLDSHLGTILAPLGTPAFAQSEILASMKATYADGLAAAPAAHKPAFQLAQGVCEAMIAAMTERQNAVAALRGALASRSSESAQNRGGAEAVEKARDRDTFFNAGQQENWTKRAAALRESISALYLRERAAERQSGAWPVAATPAPAPVAVAPVAPAPEADPVVGNWLLEGRSPLILGADHSISGDRHGTWAYTGTTGQGRNYEMHWKPPKNWTDSVTLSGDGKTMEGKTRNSQAISYSRP